MPAVEPVEQRRVGGHHEKASRSAKGQQYDWLDPRPYDYGATNCQDPHGRDVEFALAPELALLQEGHLERVACEPRDPVHDAYVGRQEHHEAGDKEDVLKPRSNTLTHGYGPVLDERQVRPDILLDAYGREDQHAEADEQQRTDEPEGYEVLLVCDLPPSLPATTVLLGVWWHVPDAWRGHLLTGYGRDDVGDMDAHAHPLIPDVVALAEVVGAAGPREGYCRQDGDSPDLLPVRGENGDPLRSLGYNSCPGRQIGGYEYRQRDECQDDDHKHSLDLFEELVDYRRESHRYGDGEKEYRGDDRCGACADSRDDECEHLGRARGPARDGVRQDRPEGEDYRPAHPHAAEARDGGLAGYQRVALYLHVQEELH